jgi:putative ABC transport system permease protein
MPDWKPEIRKRLADSKLDPARETEIIDELAQDLDECHREALAGGATEAEACRRALAELDDCEALRSVSTPGIRRVTTEPVVLGDNRKAMLLKGLWHDLRYGARTLLKQPGFTLTVIVTLAAGIGLNSAIFSVIHATLLRPLPYKDSERLAQIWSSDSQNFGESSAGQNFGKSIVVSPPDFYDWRKQARSFEHLSAYNITFAPFRTAEGATQIYGAAVTSDFFETLGVAPLLGRTFALEENDDRGPVVIVSYDFWNQYLGGRPDVVGQTVTLGSDPFTVIGVLKPDFRHPEPMADQATQYWRLVTNFNEISRKSRYLRAIGRLRQNVSFEQAQAEMSAIASRLGQAYPDSNAHRGVLLTPLQKQFTGDVRALLLLLQGAVGFVLLIACVNVANLFLARVAAREQEMAIRAAMGAGRWRLVRLLLMECLLLVLAGGGAGLLLARWGVALLASVAPREYFRLADVRPDGSSLIFTATLSLFTVLLFGLAPAWQAAKVNLNEALGGGRHTIRGRRLRGFLVIAETALALVLLVGAGLMLRSMGRLQNARLGFNAENLLTMEILAGNVRDDIDHFYDRILRRLEAMPGVKGAAITYSLPMTPLNNMSAEVEIVGRADPVPPTAFYRAVSPNYFRMMGIPLLSGRTFGERDNSSAAPVIMINEVFARRYFEGVNPIGRRIVAKLSSPGAVEGPREIVGVVAGLRHVGPLADPEPEIYTPYQQDAWNIVSLVVRTEAKPEQMAPAVQSAVWELDRNASITLVRTMDQILWDLTARPRFNLLLFGVFGLVALALAAVGVYGVMSYTVAQTTREIGVRLALGAQPGDVQRLVIGRGMALTALGVLPGLAAALGLSRLLRSWLIGVSATDPATFLITTVLLAVAALTACWIPARRATKVDPLVALRCE